MKKRPRLLFSKFTVAVERVKRQMQELLTTNLVTVAGQLDKSASARGVPNKISRCYLETKLR